MGLGLLMGLGLGWSLRLRLESGVVGGLGCA